jgi:hypothetical protein
LVRPVRTGTISALRFFPLRNVPWFGLDPAQIPPTVDNGKDQNAFLLYPIYDPVVLKYQFPYGFIFCFGNGAANAGAGFEGFRRHRRFAR